MKEKPSDTQQTDTLHAAAARSDVPVVRQLLDCGAQIDERDADGLTALHIAARAGHVPIVLFLLNRGAKVDVTNANGATALHLASERGYARIVEILLSRGARVDMASASDETALHDPVTVKSRDKCALQTPSATLLPMAMVATFSWIGGVIDGTRLITSQVKDTLVSQLMQLIQISVEGTVPENETDADVALRFTLIEMLEELGSVTGVMPGHPGSPPDPDDGGFGGGGSGDGEPRSDVGSHALLTGVSTSNTTTNSTDVIQTFSY